MTAKIVSNLFGSNPEMHVAKQQLSYPLYGADFDPLNNHFLLVGGGGGSSSTGVPNRISLLDTSNRSEIKEVSDIELAPDEDSVCSLAIADSDPSSLLAYAGINSSVHDQEAGRNEHFRSFRVPLPAKKKTGTPSFNSQVTSVSASATATRPLARIAMFRSATGPKNDCYQRVLKLSPPMIDDDAESSTLEKAEGQPKRLRKRLAAIASGLAAQNEVVAFPATDIPLPTESIARVSLEKAEANDADLTCTDKAGTSFGLVYGTDHQLFLQELGGQRSTTNSEPISVYETQKGPKGRSKIRALRFLNSRYLLLVQNRVERSGVELVVLKVSQDFAQVHQVRVKYLKNMKQAVGLDVCALSKGQDGSQQFVVAIAGQDSSIQIHVLDWIAGTGITPFKQYADMVEVHNGPITRVVFSNFISPELPVSGKTPPQYIRLATVGVDKNVVVQTLPLRPTPATGTGKLSPRYVLVASTDFGALISSFVKAFMVFMLVLLGMQAFLELRGISPPIIGATRFLPQRWQEQYGQSYPYAHDNPGPQIVQSMPGVEDVIDKIKLSEATPIIQKLEEMQDRIKLADASSIIASMQSSIPTVEEVKDTLQDLVSQKESDDEHKSKAVIVRDLEHIGGELKAELQREADVVKEGTLKKWEDLSKQDQKTWKRKLQEAGHWTEQQGETVLKGVFFGQLGGLVAGMVG